MTTNGHDFEADFTRIYDEHAKAVYRHCYFRLLDEQAAQDILQEGTKYKEKFGRARDPQTTFAFQAQYGFPTVSVVLPGQEDAIAVVKKMITQDGRDLPWSAALEELGLDRRQFKNFAEVADGILITRNNAHIQFADVELEEELEYDVAEQPKDNVKNLNASLRLSRSTRSALREVLPNLLAAEGQPTVLPMGRRRTGN